MGTLSNSSAAPADASAWASLGHLQILGLDATRIGRAGCRALQPLRGHLTTLHIGGPSVDDAACIAIARQGAGLKCLRIAGSLITQRGLDALKALWGLEELRIQGCAFVEFSARSALVAELPRLKVGRGFLLVLPEWQPVLSWKSAIIQSASDCISCSIMQKASHCAVQQRNDRRGEIHIPVFLCPDLDLNELLQSSCLQLNACC